MHHMRSQRIPPKEVALNNVGSNIAREKLRHTLATNQNGPMVSGRFWKRHQFDARATHFDLQRPPRFAGVTSLSYHCSRQLLSLFYSVTCYVYEVG